MRKKKKISPENGVAKISELVGSQHSYLLF